KTTIWRNGVSSARQDEITVLVAAPAENEALLPYAALGDLLERVIDRALPALATAQRLPLEAALHRLASNEAFDQLAVARAVLAALRHIASDETVLIAIDDVQWLDKESATVLEYVVRRLQEE